MNQCPFCGHANEDGTLYCEQCKTDLSIPAPAPSSNAPEAGLHDFGLELIDASKSGLALPETKRFDDVPLVEALEPEPTVAHPPHEPASAPESGSSAVARDPLQSSQSETTNIASAAIPKIAVVPAAAKPKLIVIRGEKIDMNYPIYPGKNYIGRTDDKPVDIDLENQEPKDRIWSSRQHAIIAFENGVLTIEDLNSLNGTFVNRTRVHPGQARTLQSDDIIQIGTVQMKVVLTPQE